MSEISTPEQVTLELCNTGAAKAKLPLGRFAVLAWLGGVFIAFGGLLTVIVAGGMPGQQAANPGIVRFVAGALFPVGLIMIVITRADLFTGDCATIVLAVFKKQASVIQLLKVWFCSYVFNFFGALFLVYFLAVKSVGQLSVSPWIDYLHNSAYSKISADFTTLFLRGIGANWLVCLAVWLGAASKDFVGKALGIWIPVMIFVTLGYEHSIANMFYIPAAIFTGASITWGEFFTVNLIPVTLGNIVGGAFFVGCLYGYLYLNNTNERSN